MINTNPPLRPHPAAATPGLRLSRHARYGAMTAYASVGAAALLALALFELSSDLRAAGLPPLELIFWRLLFAGMLFAAHTLAAHRLPSLSAGDALRATGLALLGLLPIYVAFTTAPLVYALPALLGLLAYLRLGQRAPLRKLNVLLAALLGTLLLGGFSAEASLNTLLPPLLLGTGVAGAIVLSRGLQTRYSPTGFLALAFPLAAIALLPLVPLSPQSLHHYLQLGLFAVLSSYGVYGLYYLVLNHLGIRREALWATAEPVAALLLVLMLFTPAWPALLGAGVLMGTLLYLSHGLSV